MMPDSVTQPDVIPDGDPAFGGAGDEPSGVHGGASDGLPVAALRHLSGYARNGSHALAADEPVEVVEPKAAPEAALLIAGAEQTSLTAVLESLLFVSGEAVEVDQLAKVLDLAPDVVAAGLAWLADDYKRGDRGLRLQVHNGRYQLVTAPAASAFVESFLDLETTTRLSSAALEALAVIAYRQPVTRIQIEAVRGVDCSGVLRSLMQRGLIEEVGRLEAVGRPILYAVTEQFMQHFGLMGLGELPPLPAEDADLLHATTALAGPDGARRQ